jgi:hypothetical protein
MMKCANEMLGILNREKEAERLAQLAKEAEIERLRSKMGVASINFCENEIAESIEKCALRGQSDCWITLGRSRWYDDIQDAVYRLKVYLNYYANGKNSYEPIGAPMDLNTIVEYLKHHCYDVAVYESHYMRYGFGKQRSFSLRISIPENPCK